MHDFHKPVIVSVIPRAREVCSERFEGRLAADYQMRSYPRFTGQESCGSCCTLSQAVAQTVAHFPSSSGLLMPKIDPRT
jgi:hypothetical protein